MLEDILTPLLVFVIIWGDYCKWKGIEKSSPKLIPSPKSQNPNPNSQNQIANYYSKTPKTFPLFQQTIRPSISLFFIPVPPATLPVPPTSALGAYPTYYSTTVLYFVMLRKTMKMEDFLCMMKSHLDQNILLVVALGYFRQRNKLRKRPTQSFQVTWSKLCECNDFQLPNFFSQIMNRNWYP